MRHSKFFGILRYNGLFNHRQKVRLSINMKKRTGGSWCSIRPQNENERKQKDWQILVLSKQTKKALELEHGGYTDRD